MVDRRTYLKTVGAAGIAGLAGCTGSGGNQETTTESDTETGTTTGSASKNKDPIRIGAYGPFTGPASDIGEAMKRGLKLGQEMINSNGGMAGHQVELFFGDSQSQPAQGKSAVEFLINNKNVDMIAGGFHSDVSLAVVEVTSQAGIPQMISNSVSAEINKKIQKQDMKNVFKMSPPSEAYGVGWSGMLSDLQDREVGYFPFQDKRVAMIGESTSYGLTVMDSTRQYLKDDGWNIVSEDEVSVDETNFRSLLTRIRSNNPDIVWAVQTAPSSASNLVKQFRELGFKDTHFLHTFVPSNPEYINLAGQAANGVLWMANIGVVPTFAEDIGLTAAWNEAYGTDVPGSSGSLPWDNLMIVDKVMENIGSVDDLTVDSWANTVIDLEPHKGSAGNFEWTSDGPYHQALYGKDHIPAVGHQIQNQKNQFVWPFNLADNEIDTSMYN